MGAQKKAGDYKLLWLLLLVWHPLLINIEQHMLRTIQTKKGERLSTQHRLSSYRASLSLYLRRKSWQLPLDKCPVHRADTKSSPHGHWESKVVREPAASTQWVSVRGKSKVAQVYSDRSKADRRLLTWELYGRLFLTTAGSWPWQNSRWASLWSVSMAKKSNHGFCTSGWRQDGVSLF